MVDGEIEAPTEEAAIAEIERLGLFPVNVVRREIKADAPWPNPTPSSARTQVVPIRMRARDIDILTRQLASLMKSSVPLLRSLILISEQTDKKVVKTVLEDMERQIKQGKTLSEAMSKYPQVFNNLYLNMIRAGEKSGSLDEVLTRLCQYREKEEESRQKVQAAMTYPVIVLIVGCASIFVMLTYFLPKLTVLFASMKQALPLPTKILISLSKFTSANWYMFIIAAAIIAVVLGRVKAGTTKKLLFDNILLHIPIVNKFIKNAEIAKFTRSLSMLLRNGIPVYESLGLSAGTVDNDIFRQRLKAAERDIVSQGLTISASFKKTNVFPAFTISMIAVGEEGGRLEEGLDEIANMYEREVDQAVKILTALLEPLLLLLVGGAIGFIVFAMLLPIFNLGMAPK